MKDDKVVGDDVEKDDDDDDGDDDDGDDGDDDDGDDDDDDDDDDVARFVKVHEILQYRTGASECANARRNRYTWARAWNDPTIRRPSH